MPLVYARNRLKITIGCDNFLIEGSGGQAMKKTVES
jgi:hypothetical protein